MAALWLAACSTSRENPTDAPVFDAASGADQVTENGGGEVAPPRDATAGEVHPDGGAADQPDTGQTSTGSDALDSRDPRSDARCTGAPVANNGGCAATFELQKQQDPYCIAPLAGLTECVSREGACGAYQVYYAPVGIFSLLCVYDSAGTQLLSVTNCSDVDIYCDGASSCITRGADIDVSTSCNTQLLPRAPLRTDGGVDRSGGD